MQFVLLILLLSALYLLGPAHDVMDGSTAFAVLLHSVVGLASLLPGVFWLRRLGRQAKEQGRTPLFVLLLLAFLLCAMAGCWLFGKAASGVSIARDTFLLGTHTLTGFVGVLVFGLFMWRKSGGSVGSWALGVGRSSESAGPLNGPAAKPGVETASVERVRTPGTKTSPSGWRSARRPHGRGEVESLSPGTEPLAVEQPSVPLSSARTTGGTPPRRGRFCTRIGRAVPRPGAGDGATSPFPSGRGFRGRLPGHSLAWTFVRASLFLLLPFLLWLMADYAGKRNTALVPKYDAEAYFRDLTATNATQAENSLFPAGVRLPEYRTAAQTAHNANEQNAVYCGRDGCHREIYQKWHDSAHRRAGSDAVYARVRDEFAMQKGKEAAQWCKGCHQPTDALSPTKPLPAAATDTAGVDCLACHAMTGTPTRTGNGRFTLDVPPTYPFAAAPSGWKKQLHDFLLRVRPGPHQRAFAKPELHRTAEACSACHRQSFNVPQNGYQFVRTTDGYGEWQSGPCSGRTVRTASLKRENPQTCQSCHFPPDAAGPTSHYGTGANTFLNPVRQKATEAFLRQNRITLDIFALRRKAGTTSGERWQAPLDAPLETPEPLRPGETVTLDIVVTNRNTGHNFPSGYEDIKEAWLEVTVSDAQGKTLLVNGTPQPDGTLPSDTHVYRSLLLDRKGDALTRHDIHRQVTTVYRRTIPSGGSDIARYRFAVPANARRVTAVLRSRPLRPDFAQWAVGTNAIPITTLANAQTALTGTKAEPSASNGPAERFLAYGLALLAPPEGFDLPGAIRAFQAARKLAPDLPEPCLGLGRAYLREPALLAARAQFETALRLAPAHPEARAGLGVVYSKQGVFDQAIALLKPLAEAFPQDVTLLRDLGTAYYKQGSYAEAADSFERALAADPDDAAAHFQLKQCYQRLRKLPEARREEVIGRYLAEDRFRSKLVPDYLRTNAEARNAARAFPEHRIVPMRR